MKLEEAEKYATQVIEAIRDLCETILVVGSIRRRRPEVNDIDIVVIPDYSDYRIPDLLHNTTQITRVNPDETWTKNLPKVLNEKLHARIIRKGPELITIELPDEKGQFSTLDPKGFFVFIQIDIYRARKETWGVLTLIRTGSKEHNVKLCSCAKDMGYKLSAKDGVTFGARVIASETEEEIFKALGMEYVPPEHREVI